MEKKDAQPVQGLITTNTGFTFSNPKCLVDFYIDYDCEEYYQKKIRITKIENEVIKFHYTNSIYKADDSSEEHDLLMELISLPDQNEKKLVKFIESYGFIFSISSEKYSIYSCNEIFEIIKRIRYLVEIITEINKIEPSYKILTDNLVYFILMPSITISDHRKNTNQNKHLYQSAEHQIRKDLIDIGVLTLEPENSYEFENAEIDPDLFYFHEKKLQFEENYQYFETVPPHINLQLKFLKYVLSLSQIYSIHKTDGIYVEESLNPKPDENQKEIILKTAKMILKEEIDYNTRNIIPKYNIESMLGSWDIPDLINAIYFSIFFLNPRFSVVKKCANPTCPNYFQILKSRKNKIYCSTICGWAVNQRKQRIKNVQKK
ncbi:hypothetical protein [uncultured Acetobacterium sp.]|uniref:hypothetical protein n=1 Tax=uncultured Acetobacterium sp. TaxID=217139 RepID=UPI0025E5A0F1|nr:hypothetical protein [uncultured Acetobacterium sp.]